MPAPEADSCSQCGCALPDGLPAGVCAACALRAALRDAQMRDEPPEEIRLPEISGRYEALGEVGRGGMGRATAVHDAVLHRDVVLKELLTDEDSGDATNSPDFERRRRRFLREAHITAQLEHPSIMPVHELGYRADGTPYYTMKRVRGRTLADALAAADTLEERLAFLPAFVDVCQALAYAHECGVVHRDVKPSNIMLGEFGETVLLDWGLAKTTGADDNGEHIHDGAHGTAAQSPATQTGTATGELLGSPLYMAPEQATQDPEDVDHRVDVYALGVILHELLTGRTLYEWSSASHAVQEMSTTSTPNTLEFGPDVPKDLGAICVRAIARDPDARYGTAGELARDVLAFQSGALVAVYRYSLVEYLRRLVRKHKQAFAAGLAALMLIVGLSIIYGVRDRGRHTV